MSHRIRNIAIGGKPGRCLAMQAGALGLRPPVELAAQEVAEQMVITKPMPYGIERDQEQVGAFDNAQHAGTIMIGADRLHETEIEPLEDGGAQQEILDVCGLASQDLMGEEVGDIALAAREVGNEGLLRSFMGERQ